MRLINRVVVGVLFYGTALMLGGCAKDSSVSKADSAAAADTTAIGANAEATNAPGTLEGPSRDSNSVRAPIGSTEGTIGETRKPTSHNDAPRDSAIAGPYKTIDSLGHIKK
ncbi:MAG: hypothetical protein ABIZ36_06245 [Gemmatimonadaceae bacterium]